MIGLEVIGLSGMVWPLVLSAEGGMVKGDQRSAWPRGEW